MHMVCESAHGGKCERLPPFRNAPHHLFPDSVDESTAALVWFEVLMGVLQRGHAGWYGDARQHGPCNKRVRWPTCRARQQHFSWRGWNNETTRVTRLDNSHQNMLRQSSYHGFFDTSFWSNVYPQKINCNNNSELGRLEQCWWMIWKHCRLIS